MNVTPQINPPVAQPVVDAVAATLSTYGSMFRAPPLKQPAYDFKFMLSTLQRNNTFDFKFGINDLPLSVVFTKELLITDLARAMHELPLRNHRFFTGAPTLHFYLPKMDVQTGMLSFYYTPYKSEFTNLGAGNVVIWDISLKNVFTYEIPNVQPYLSRTLIDSEINSSVTSTSDVVFVTSEFKNTHDLASFTTTFGTLSIVVSSPLVSGNIAPTELSIICYTSCENIDVSTYGPYIDYK